MTDCEKLGCKTEEISTCAVCGGKVTRTRHATANPYSEDRSISAFYHIPMRTSYTKNCIGDHAFVEATV